MVARSSQHPWQQECPVCRAHIGLNVEVCPLCRARVSTVESSHRPRRSPIWGVLGAGALVAMVAMVAWRRWHGR